MTGCLRCAPAEEVGPPGEDGSCPRCGRGWLLLPFFSISGATGVGKSTSCEPLSHLLPECLRLDSDLLWRTEYFDDPVSADVYRKQLLHIAVEIAQHGRPLVLCGVSWPDWWERLPARMYVREIHYLALVCDPEEHEARLRGREADPARLDGDPHYAEYLNHNRWLIENASTTRPPIERLDTTSLAPQETTERIVQWVRARL